MQLHFTLSTPSSLFLHIFLLILFLWSHHTWLTHLFTFSSLPFAFLTSACLSYLLHRPFIPIFPTLVLFNEHFSLLNPSFSPLTNPSIQHCHSSVKCCLPSASRIHAQQSLILICLDNNHSSLLVNSSFCPSSACSSYIFLFNSLSLLIYQSCASILPFSRYHVTVSSS